MIKTELEVKIFLIFFSKKGSKPLKSGVLSLFLPQKLNVIFFFFEFLKSSFDLKYSVFSTILTNMTTL